MNRLKNKIIVVTGGSGLLGKEFIKNIKSEGGIPVNADINVDTNLDKNQINMDITSQQSVDNTVEILLDYFGHIDGLVNNAYPRTKDWGASFESIPLDSWRKNVDFQLNSYFYLTQKLLPVMIERKMGSIIFIASIYGVVGNDFTIYEGTDLEPPAAYSAVKGGLINFSKFLASKYGKCNIRVNCVSPGGIFDSQPTSFVDNYEKKVPMKRMGTPQDISPAVTFLLSEDAGYVTGQNLVVDGGWTSI